MSVARDSEASRLAEAKVAADAKEWDRAATVMQGLDSIEALGKRAFYLSRAKHYEEAIVVLEELRLLEPSRAVWPYMIGYQHYEQQSYEGALPWFRLALKNDPSHFKTLYRSAQTLHQLGRELPAQIMAGRAVQRWQAMDTETQKREQRLVANAYLLLGRAQIRNDAVGATELLKLAVAHDPHDHHKLYRLGQALRRAGRPNEAITHLRSANKIKLEPHAGVELAAALKDAGEEAAAVEQLRQVAPRCRGWTAVKAARIAAMAGAEDLTLELLQVGTRDAAVRRDPHVAEELGRARAKQPRATDDTAQTATVGRVDVVRTDRNFGFLVADDGIRRHFRLSDAAPVSRGQRVTFKPLTRRKGPAASDVVPA